MFTFSNGELKNLRLPKDIGNTATVEGKTAPSLFAPSTTVT